ncbi:glycosyltransferase [Vulcaniibacterium gelatinicum]|uniref:glycosyltransferase n=1 Tax=Vulcaniibacterium gelatinicum TaxID=2598725 RepID=UPI0011C8C841|nr:glycosyltransferase [Vulcaniibacterium gelatinicum]
MSSPLISIFLPRLSAGGAERVLLAIAGALAERGYRCEVVTAQPGGHWENRIPAGVRHRPLGRAKPLHAVPALASYLRRERPQVLLSSVFAANLAALLACRLAGKATRCVVREANWTAEEVMAPSLLTTMVNAAALRSLYGRADAVIALSDDLAVHIAQAARVPRSKIHVIPNPSLPGDDPPVRAPADTGDPPLILGCGRLEPQKDFPLLIRAFAQVRAQRSARLVILGEGSERQALMSLAESLGVARDVALPGYSDDPHSWMRRARLFVSSSRHEGFPNVHLEALQNGCPIVSTCSSDAVAMILDGGRLGAIVPVGDVDSLARQMLAVLDGTLTFPSPGEHLARFELGKIVDRYLEVLDPMHLGPRTAMPLHSHS